MKLTQWVQDHPYCGLTYIVHNNEVHFSEFDCAAGMAKRVNKDGVIVEVVVKTECEECKTNSKIFWSVRETKDV